jgi:hypothetical protein
VPTASAAKTTPSPRLRDTRPQRAIDEVIASIVGTRALVRGPGAGRPRVEDCAYEYRQEQRTYTNQHRERGRLQFSSNDERDGDLLGGERRQGGRAGGVVRACRERRLLPVKQRHLVTRPM